MNKVGFMGQLESLLADVPAAEREEALQYYNDYFEDAGAENEQSVIESLGSPVKVAENIKAELSGEAIPTSANAGEHKLTKYGQIVPAGEVQDKTEHANGNTSQGQPGAPGAGGRSFFGAFGGVGGAGGAGAGGAGGAGGASYANPDTGTVVAKVTEVGRKLPFWAWILIAIAVICVVIPGIVSVFGGLLGVISGIFVTWFALIIAFGAIAFSMFVVAIVVVVVAILCLIGHPMTGVLLLGISMLFACVGILFLMLTVWMSGKATPFICGKIIDFIKFCWNGTKKLFARIK